MTTVISAYVVTLDDDIAEVVRETVEAYRTERAVVYQRSGRTYRSPRGWTRWSATIEIDLIHPKLARLCSRTKADLLSELGVDVATLRADQRVVIVHEHAVVDHRGHASADVLMRDIRTAWPGARRVHARRLHTEGTVAENLDRLANYSSKFVFRYGIAWNGKKTSYLSNYEPEWRELVRRLYRKIGILRLLNANVTSQSGKFPDCTGMHTTGRDRRAEPAPREPEQLSVFDDGRGERRIEEDHTHNDDHNTHTGMTEETGHMKIREIIDGYIDIDVPEDVEAALARRSSGLTDDERAIMYGDEAQELDLARQRLELVRLQAEVEEILASAAKDRAEADRQRRSGP